MNFRRWVVFTFLIPQAPGARDNGYILFLIAGLVPWIGFNEGIMRSATSIVDNATLVRRLAFKSELLVVVPSVSAILFESIGIALCVIFIAITRSVSPRLWVLPFAILVQFAIQAGIGWFLATVYVFFRDVIQILGFFLSIVFYLSPILYPVSHRFESLFLWNPLTPLLGLFRSAMIGSPLPPPASIVFLLIVATVIFSGGLAFFRRAQGTLADLI